MLSGNVALLQMMLESLGSAVAAQDGRVGGLEQHTAQLQFFIEALRLGQEEQQGSYSAPPPAAHQHGGCG